jgi:pSer/pThr/pTyr-binding forkhead associated (FHA) protein
LEAQVIVCPRCSKENQDHYKFCLGCGAELPRDVARKENAFRAPTPPEGVPAVESAPKVEAKQAAPEPQGTSCPKCGADVPANFKFCGSCGNVMGAPAVAQPAAAKSSGIIGALSHIRQDGTLGERIDLTDGMVVGRSYGGIFAEDGYLSPTHARFTSEGGQLVVEDLGSVNGIYVRLVPNDPVVLEHGSVFRIGQEIVRFERLPTAKEVNGTALLGGPNPGFLGRICLVLGPNSVGNCYCIPADGIHLGRERGDIIFPDDGYVSGLHCRVHTVGGNVVLTDVGSSNGTYLRLGVRSPLIPGALVLIGQQLLRVEA